MPPSYVSSSARARRGEPHGRGGGRPRRPSVKADPRASAVTYELNDASLSATESTVASERSESSVDPAKLLGARAGIEHGHPASAARARARGSYATQTVPAAANDSRIDVRWRLRPGTCGAGAHPAGHAARLQGGAVGASVHALETLFDRYDLTSPPPPPSYSRIDL